VGNTEQCVEFYYYQEARAIGLLNIYAVFSTLNYSTIGFPLWTESLIDNGIRGWQLAQVSLGHSIVSKPYQILFEEYIDANYPGIYLINTFFF